MQACKQSNKKGLTGIKDLATEKVCKDGQQIKRKFIFNNSYMWLEARVKS